jgi:putative lysine transport system permease protein
MLYVCMACFKLIAATLLLGGILMSFEVIQNILVEYWPLILRGASVTLSIALISTIIGAFIGFFTGVMHTIPTRKRTFKTVILKIINAILTCYVEIFRGTPMIVQAVVVFYGLAAYGMHLNTFVAGVIVVSLNTGAYMAEIVRGGIISIDKGQYEAAEAIGMNHFQTMVYVIIPQVFRNSLPATGNQLVMNIKDSAVLNVISVSELFFLTKSIQGSTFKTFEPFLVTCIVYLIMTITATQLIRMLERKLDNPKAYKLVEKEQV